jgi:hypothetical protein
MKKMFLTAALLAAGLAAATPALAAEKPLTIAVFGDWPYNQLLLDNAALLTDSVNADAEVSLVLHVGDIHSGSTSALVHGWLPPIATANPSWNLKVFDKFQQFHAPLVYTPGDNEWTDCHKAKEKSSGFPLKELAAVRGLFFSRPGHSLGLNERLVLSQAQQFDPAFPADAQFVENVMWEDGKVVFVTLNMPGSNNDSVPWTGIFADPVAQAREVAERNDANARWLQRAFATADDHNARAMVIGLQADMWDPAALLPGADGLDKYTPFVAKLADLTLHFGRPVLLLNGDSHVFGSDQPLADPASATVQIHGTAAVPNLTRITVQGSTSAPAEWLRLSIDTRQRLTPFSWTNVPYCVDPLTACQ